MISLVTVLVENYDEAIDFFVRRLGFELVDDTPSVGSVTGRAKRWVVVKPSDGQTGLLIAEATGAEQEAAVGNQVGGRVGFFLRVDDFDASYRSMLNADVEFLEAPRDEPYGRVAVFVDVAGNRWDLLGPTPVT